MLRDKPSWDTSQCHTTFTIRNKQENLEGKDEANFDTLFILQSHAESIKKLWEPFGICLIKSTANPAQFWWKWAGLLVSRQIRNGYQYFFILSAWVCIINGVLKWLHLCPKICLAFFWQSRWCDMTCSNCFIWLQDLSNDAKMKELL